MHSRFFQPPGCWLYLLVDKSRALSCLQVRLQLAALRRFRRFRNFAWERPEQAAAAAGLQCRPTIAACFTVQLPLPQQLHIFQVSPACVTCGRSRGGGQEVAQVAQLGLPGRPEIGLPEGLLAEGLQALEHRGQRGGPHLEHLGKAQQGRAAAENLRAMVTRMAGMYFVHCMYAVLCT